MSITIALVHDLETKIREVAKREGLAPDAYAAKVLTQHLSKQALAVPEAEAKLLQQINLGLSEKTWRRYSALREKLEDETLKSDEQQELIIITDQIEAANVRRMEALIKLAELRKTTLDALIDVLELRPLAYV
jgi:hypothetical protein